MNVMRALLVAVLAVLLASCVSVPTAGRVVAGGEVRADGARAALRVAATGPLPGASPEEIVQGFLAAVAGLDDYLVAREFLAAEAQAPWRPSEQTSIHQGAVEVRSAPAADAAPREVTVLARVEARIDDAGRYTQEVEPVEQVDSFELERVDGEWRIIDLPQGVLVSSVDADRVLTPYAVYFPDPTSTYLVPDVRWFPQLTSSAAPLVRALLGGPSSWLLGAVATGSVPPGTRLQLPTVPVEDGLAVVDLSQEVLSTGTDDLAMLRYQLERTLRAVPGVSTVELRVDDNVLEGPEIAGQGLNLPVDPVVDNRPLLLGLPPAVEVAGGPTAAQGAGSVDGTPDGGSGSSVEPEPPASVEPAPETAVAAPGTGPEALPVAVPGSQVLRLGIDGPEVVQRAGDLAQVVATGLAVSSDGESLAGLDAARTTLLVQRSGGEAVATVSGTGLTTPSFDPAPYDGVWTATAASAQDDRPRVLHATTGVEEVEVGWLGAGDQLRALRVSRDGTRVVAVVAAPDGRVVVQVAGVRRDPSGAPLSLSSTPLPVAVGLTDAVDVAWVSADEVVVLGRTGEEALRPVLAQVGGTTTPLAPAPAAATVTSGFGERNIVVGTRTGAILTRSGGQWVEAPTRGVSPAFAG